MILTENRLKQIIAEELENILSEEQLDEALPKWLRNLGAAAGIATVGYLGGQAAGDEGIPRDRASMVAKDSDEASRIKPKEFGQPVKKKIKKIKAKKAEPAEHDAAEQSIINKKLPTDVEEIAMDIYAKFGHGEKIGTVLKNAKGNKQFLQGLSREYGSLLNQEMKNRLQRLMNQYGTTGLPWD